MTIPKPSKIKDIDHRKTCTDRHAVPGAYTEGGGGGGGGVERSVISDGCHRSPRLWR